MDCWASQRSNKTQGPHSTYIFMCVDYQNQIRGVTGAFAFGPRLRWHDQKEKRRGHQVRNLFNGFWSGEMLRRFYSPCTTSPTIRVRPPKLIPQMLFRGINYKLVCSLLHICDTWALALLRLCMLLSLKPQSSKPQTSNGKKRRRDIWYLILDLGYSIILTTLLGDGP